MATQRAGTPTIYDVARAAGVAPSTVSRAFSRPGRVNAETAERIRAIAEDLGYRTNPLARAVTTGRTGMIALIVSDVTNPVYFPVLRGAEEAAAAAGYTTVVGDMQDSAELERGAVARALPLVEGIVLAGSRVPDTAIRKVASMAPLVVLHRVVAGVPCVVTDNPRGIRRAVEHLAELGHTSMTYVAGPEASWADGVRWRAVLEGCHELDLRSHRIGPFAATVAGGLAAASQIVERDVTAVIAYNDLVAVGVLKGLARAGVRVPDDVSVVGFDNTIVADICSPALTTVAAPLRALGTTAVEDLLRQIRSGSASGPGRERPAQVATLPARLVVRESTGLAAKDDAARVRRHVTGTRKVSMSEQRPVQPEGPSGTESSEKPVVTLFEYYGAGASTVGHAVADALGLPFHPQAFSSEDIDARQAATENAAVLARVFSVMGGAYGGLEGRDVAVTQREKYDLVMLNNAEVWRSADEGGVILGRNAAVVLQKRPNTLHVLLTGDVDDRVTRAAAEEGISPRLAAERQKREDDVRAQMSIVLYGWDPRVPDRYDLVINTSRIPPEAAAAAIIDAVGAWREGAAGSAQPEQDLPR